MASIEAGKQVPIKLLLDDGNPDKFVSAKILDDENNLLETVALTSISEGVYAYSAYVMPSLPHISVIYTVYDDIGWLIVSEEYTIELDVFVEVGSSSGGGGGANYIIGKIKSNKITGTIQSKNITAKIKNSVVNGNVTAVKTITASITKDDFIKGEIDG